MLGWQLIKFGMITRISVLLVPFAFCRAAAAFSTLTPPVSTKAPSNAAAFPDIFSGLKRATLKKQLIKASNDKDEQLVIQLVEELSELNPTQFPTYGLGGYVGEDDVVASTTRAPPLDGEWRLLFTNAKDAEAPARTEKKKEKETSGFDDEVRDGVVIKTGQRINADEGECINYIYATGEKRPFDQLEITIKMTALSPTRVRLDFQRGRALNENAPLSFLKDFRFSFPPAYIGDAIARLKGKDPSIEPPAFFDVLYLDNEVRAHRTGEGKIFVQRRP